MYFSCRALKEATVPFQFKSYHFKLIDWMRQCTRNCNLYIIPQSCNKPYFANWNRFIYLYGWDDQLDITLNQDWKAYPVLRPPVWGSLDSIPLWLRSSGHSWEHENNFQKSLLTGESNLQLQRFSLSQTATNDFNYWSKQTWKKDREKEGVFLCPFLPAEFHVSDKCTRTHLAVLRGRDQPAEKDWPVQNDLSCSEKLGISALWLAIISGFNLIHNHLAVVLTIACVCALLCSWMYLSCSLHLTEGRCEKGGGRGDPSLKPLTHDRSPLACIMDLDGPWCTLPIKRLSDQWCEKPISRKEKERQNVSKQIQH